jgi:hypothetical protein
VCHFCRGVSCPAVGRHILAEHFRYLLLVPATKPITSIPRIPKDARTEKKRKTIRFRIEIQRPLRYPVVNCIRLAGYGLVSTARDYLAQAQLYAGKCYRPMREITRIGLFCLPKASGTFLIIKLFGNLSPKALSKERNAPSRKTQQIYRGCSGTGRSIY